MFLVLSVPALHLSVVTERIGTIEYVAYLQLGSRSLKQGLQIPLAVGKSVGKLESVVRLDTLHPDTPAGIPLAQSIQKVGRRVGALLGVGIQEAQAGEFIVGGILEQTQFRVGNTPSGYDFHIHLDSLIWIRHLLISLGFVYRFLLCHWK